MEQSAMENGKEGSQEGTKEEVKKTEENLTDFVLKFTQDTSIHGVKHSFDFTRNRPNRMVWILLVLTAIISLLKMLFDLYCSYMEYEVQTVLKVSHSDKLPFPAVTICNLNGMELSKLQAQDTSKVNVSAAIATLSLMTSLFSVHSNRTIENELQVIPAELLDKTFQEVSTKAFADLKTTLISCAWDGQEEKCEDMFRPLDFEMRRCFQFNGHLPRRVAYSSGLTSGLQVVVNVRQEEYLFDELLSAGAQVILHEPGEMPDIKNKGLLVSPGNSIVCRTAMQKYKYLPDPFRAYGEQTCVNYNDISSPAFDMANVTVYTSALCRRMCVDAMTQRTCGCRVSNVSFTSDSTLPLCTVREVYACYVHTFANQTKHSTECTCPRRCQRTEYEVSISSAYFPSDAAMKILQKRGLVHKDVARKNFFDLKIFYDDLVSSEISHVPKYTVDTILGTIGGQMGLFIGASLLSLAEVGYLLLSLGYRGARALWRRKSDNPAVRVKVAN